jgi:capsular polysaccharide biosynthesis protein
LRQIVNEQEVKEFLIKKNFSIIALSDLSFEDQVNLFNHASQIVGLHGAGFANLTFCNPETKVLELKPSGAGLVIANLAKKVKLNYQEISPNPLKYSNNNQQGLIKIPLNLLEKKII